MLNYNNMRSRLSSVNGDRPGGSGEYDDPYSAANQQPVDLGTLAARDDASAQNSTDAYNARNGIPTTQTPAAPAGQFSWNGQAYGGSGLTGSSGQFGNNFIGMQGYLNANKTPGLSDASYQTYAKGPNADYSKNMAGLDSSIYGYYGVQGNGQQQTAAAATATTGTSGQAEPQPQSNNFSDMRNQINGDFNRNRRQV